MAVTNFGSVPAVGTFETSGQTGSFVSTIINTLTVASGIALLIYATFAGFNYVTSGGDQKRMDSARKMLTNAIIGFILVASAYFVVGFLGKRLGIVNIFNPSI